MRVAVVVVGLAATLSSAAVRSSPPRRVLADLGRDLADGFDSDFSDVKPRGGLKLAEGGIHFGPDSDVSITRTGTTELSVDGRLLVDGVDVVEALRLLQEQYEKLRALVSPSCASVDTASAEVHGGAYHGTASVSGGDYVHEEDVDSCDTGYGPNTNTTWVCSVAGGVATLSDQVGLCTLSDQVLCPACMHGLLMLIGLLV
jgi:hypothetical protein